MKKMLTMFVLVLSIGIASTTLVGCSKEAKKEGTTLSGVAIQSAKYQNGLPDGLPRWSNPLPFAFESTGVETRFTNGLDPEPRARGVFAFHRPEHLADLVQGPERRPERRGPPLTTEDRGDEAAGRTRIGHEGNPKSWADAATRAAAGRTSGQPRPSRASSRSRSAR